MSFYPKGTFSGNYIPRGDTIEADCVIGNEFAAPKPDNGFGAVNVALARFIADRFVGLPMMLNRNIAGALQQINQQIQPELVFSGDSANITGTRGEGTWGELRQAKQFMDEQELRKPIIVAQAFHVGRVAAQAELFEISPIVPADLPEQFDPLSDQRWTRGWLMWATHELLGVPVLRRRGEF